jgi:hypothetical protein
VSDDVSSVSYNFGLESDKSLMLMVFIFHLLVIGLVIFQERLVKIFHYFHI